MTELKLSDIDWTGPAVNINDALIEIWFERHPEVGRDDRSLPDAEAWADEMFAKHAEPAATDVQRPDMSIRGQAITYAREHGLRLRPEAELMDTAPLLAAVEAHRAEQHTQQATDV